METGQHSDLKQLKVADTLSRQLNCGFGNAKMKIVLPGEDIQLHQCLWSSRRCTKICLAATLIDQVTQDYLYDMKYAFQRMQAVHMPERHCIVRFSHGDGKGHACISIRIGTIQTFRIHECNCEHAKSIPCIKTRPIHRTQWKKV